jgi:hypothetical protein
LSLRGEEGIVQLDTALVILVPVPSVKLPD